MDKFEYKSITLKSDIFVKDLNDLGDKGWELVNVEYETDRIILKRKKEKILCDMTTKIISTNIDRFGSYTNQCKELLSDGYELSDIIRNKNGDYYAHLKKYEYK